MTDWMRQRYRDLVLAILDECNSIDRSATFIPVADDPTLIAAIANLVEENEQGEMLLRGEACHFPDVSSSLYRSLALPVGGDSRSFETLAPRDSQTIDQVPSSAGITDSAISKLSHAQHYSGEQGTPTNLIDLTSNLATALFFACRADEYSDCDGRVILIDSGGYPLQADLDLQRAEDQLVMPSFYDDNRNFDQWSTFLYPAKGVLDPVDYRVVSIQAAWKAKTSEFLHDICGISDQGIFTSGQSNFEDQSNARRSVNLYHLGLISEWLGDLEGAKRLYQREGARYLPDAVLRRFAIGCYEEGATLRDISMLHLALSGKATHYRNVAVHESWDLCSIEKAEWLWRASQRFGRLAKEICPELGSASSIPSNRLVLYEMGRLKCNKGVKDGDRSLVEDSIHDFHAALQAYEMEEDPDVAPMPFDISITLARAHSHLGEHPKTVTVLEQAFKHFEESPQVEEARILLEKAGRM